MDNCPECGWDLEQDTEECPNCGAYLADYEDGTESE
jgi:rubrerythrin